MFFGITIAKICARTPNHVRKEVTMFLYQFLLVGGFVLTTITALNIKRFTPTQEIF